MTTPSSKSHLYASPGPMRVWDGPIFVQCGRKIQSAKVLMQSEIPIIGQKWESFRNSLTSCDKCMSELEELFRDPPESVKDVKVWHIYSLCERESKLGQQVAQAEESV